MTKRADPVEAVLSKLERQGLIDVHRDEETGAVLGYGPPYEPPPPAKRGRGRYPAPHTFRDGLIRYRFEELAKTGEYDFRQVPGKPNKAAIRRALAKEQGLSEERIRKILSE